MKFPLESLIFKEWFILGMVKITEEGFMEWGGETFEDVVEPD